MPSDCRAIRRCEPDFVDRKGLDRRAASTSQMGPLRDGMPAGVLTDDNLAGLTALSGFWIDRVHDRRPPKIDRPRHGRSSVSPTQWRTGRNRLQRSLRMRGCTAIIPLIRVEPVRRSGTVRPASWSTCTPQMAGARCWSRSISRRYRDRKLPALLSCRCRLLASPEVYEFLEAEGFLYAIRLPANRVLQR